VHQKPPLTAENILAATQKLRP